MSLVAWYPLNGDTLDYSGNSNHATNNGATISTDGNIGKCYSFDGINNNLQINNINLYSRRSISLWIKVSSFPSDSRVIFAHGISKIGLGFYSGNQFILTSNGNTQRCANSTGFIVGMWNHICLKYGIDNIPYMFINGIETTYTTSNSWTSSNSIFYIGMRESGTNVNCKLNDFRIYDHCLSMKEIIELSKAKIAHYTFDTQVQPYTNIIKNNTYSIYNNAGNIECPSTLVATGEYYQGCAVYRLTQTPTDSAISTYGFKTSMGSHGIYFGSRVYTKLIKYCASIMWKPISHPDIKFGGNAQNAPSYWNVGTDKVIANGWTKYHQYINGVNNIEDKSNPVFFSYYVPSLLSGQSIVIDFCCPSVIQGRISPIEIDYNYNEYNIIEDVSGYNNYITTSESTTPDWVSDSRIGSGAYYFNGISNYLKVNSLPSTFTSLTISTWFKKIGEGGNYECVVHKALDSTIGATDYWVGVETTDMIVATIGANTGVGWSAGKTTVKALLNTWYNVTVTWNGTIVKIYINGVYNKQYSLTTYGNKIAPTRIGASSDGAEYQFNGIIDDVRIYTTALSDNDILELYQTRIQLDDTSNLYVGSISEPYNYFTPDRFYLTVNSPSQKPIYEIADGSNTWDVYPAYFHPNGAILNTFKTNTQYNIHITFKHYTYYNTEYVAGGFTIKYTDATTTSLITTGNTGWKTFDILSDKNKTILGIWVYYHSSFRIYIDRNSYITEYTPMTHNENGILSCNNLSEVGITNGLIAYYPLDGNSNDYSGNNNHATIFGSIICGGFNQSAYKFDGIDDYINLNIPISLFNDLQSFTIGMWVKLTTVSPTVGLIVIGLQSPSDSRIYIGKSTTGTKWAMGIGNSPWSGGTATVTTDITYLVMTVNKTNSTAVLYVNGVIAETKTGWIWGNITTSPVLGKLSSSYYTDEIIQDVRIYNRELSIEEVNIMYDLGIGNTAMKVTPMGNVYINNEIKEV